MRQASQASLSLQRVEFLNSIPHCRVSSFSTICRADCQDKIQQAIKLTGKLARLHLCDEFSVSLLSCYLFPSSFYYLLSEQQKYIKAFPPSRNHNCQKRQQYANLQLSWTFPQTDVCKDHKCRVRLPTPLSVCNYVVNLTLLSNFVKNSIIIVLPYQESTGFNTTRFRPYTP